LRSKARELAQESRFPTRGRVMEVEVRDVAGRTLGAGRLRDEEALALRKDDEVVFPFIDGGWVICNRHVMIRKDFTRVTFTVEPS
jgi:hypothetical protein